MILNDKQINDVASMLVRRSTKKDIREYLGVGKKRDLREIMKYNLPMLSELYNLYDPEDSNKDLVTTKEDIQMKVNQAILEKLGDIQSNIKDVTSGNKDSVTLQIEASEVHILPDILPLELQKDKEFKLSSVKARAETFTRMKNFIKKQDLSSQDLYTLAFYEFLQKYDK